MSVSWYSDLENAFSRKKENISVIFPVPETIIRLNVVKIKLLTYRWQKLFMPKERNGKCLILPAALNSVPVQGQENRLKPSPWTRLGVSS